MNSFQYNIYVFEAQALYYLQTINVRLAHLAYPWSDETKIYK